MSDTKARTCQVLVYRVADLPPERAYPSANLTRWRWELWDGDVFLTGATTASEEPLAYKQAHNAADALGYRA